MNAKVVYYSKTGNTRKLAEAIAEAVGTTAEGVDKSRIDKTVDVLFVGGAVYATYEHNFHPSLTSFIRDIDKTKVRKVVAFGTYAFGSSISKLIDVVKATGLPVMDQSYVCKGKFLFFNMRRPNNDDLLRAGEFAKAIVADGKRIKA
jgi:flavodoxin